MSFILRTKNFKHSISIQILDLLNHGHLLKTHSIRRYEKPSDMENTFVLTYFIYGMSVTQDERFRYNLHWNNRLIYFWVCRWHNANVTLAFIQPKCDYDLRKDVIKPDFDPKSITIQPDFHNFYATDKKTLKHTTVKTSTKEPSAGFSVHSNGCFSAIMIGAFVYFWLRSSSN